MHRINAFKFVALALAITASACGTDDPVEPDGAHEFTIKFCPEIPQVVGVAQQDGDGAWQVVTPSGEPRTYHFAFDAARAGIALQSSFLAIYYATPAQLEQYLRLMENSCGIKSFTGSLLGLGDGDSAVVSLSTSTFITDSPVDPQPFSFFGIRPGPRDLVAMARGADVRYIIRAGLDLPDGTVIAPLDFTSAEAITGAHANITVPDVNGDMSLAYTTFGGDLGLLSRFAPITPGATYDAVPAARLPSGRAQALSIEATTESGSQRRHADIFFRNVVDRTVTLGPSLPNPTISVRVSGPYAFPTLTLPAQPEYGRWMHANFSTGVDGDQINVISFAAEYFGSTPSTWVVTLPDLTSLPGFQPAWALQSGGPISYQVGAGGGTRPWPFGFYSTSLVTPVDGDESRRVFRSGFTTP